MRRGFVIALLALFFIAGCAGPLKFLIGGGPNVAANVQAGKSNTQTVGKSENISQEIIRPRAREINQSADRNKVSADTVHTVTVNERTPPWIWITWAILLFLDSPVRWPGQIWTGIQRHRKRVTRAA